MSHQQVWADCTSTQPTLDNRDEVAGHGMLRIAMDALLRVHGRVFQALSAPPTALPDGRKLFARWDVPFALEQERLQVTNLCIVGFTPELSRQGIQATRCLWPCGRSQAIVMVWGQHCTAEMAGLQSSSMM